MGGGCFGDDVIVGGAACSVLRRVMVWSCVQLDLSHWADVCCLCVVMVVGIFAVVVGFVVWLLVAALIGCFVDRSVGCGKLVVGFATTLLLCVRLCRTVGWAWIFVDDVVEEAVVVGADELVVVVESKVAMVHRSMVVMILAHFCLAMARRLC